MENISVWDFIPGVRLDVSGYQAGLNTGMGYEIFEGLIARFEECESEVAWVGSTCIVRECCTYG